MTSVRAILWGTLAVGAFDAIDAVVFFGSRGATPIRIFQSIAGGLLGRTATYQGGLPTAFLGLVLHFFIAFGIVVVFYAVSRKLTLLTRRPVLCGLAYGVLVFFVMNEIVIPLSALGRGKYSLPGLLNGVLGHAFLVGMPAALFVAQAPRASSPAPRPASGAGRESR
jgi:hypothetical protein